MLCFLQLKFTWEGKNSYRLHTKICGSNFCSYGGLCTVLTTDLCQVYSLNGKICNNNNFNTDVAFFIWGINPTAFGPIVDRSNDSVD